MSSELRDYEVGGKIGGYEVRRTEPLPKVHGAYYELVHEPTGARHIHMILHGTGRCGKDARTQILFRVTFTPTDTPPCCCWLREYRWPALT